ncbi:aa3-type cytochrome oxidase subunit CtaJ [Mycolicibacterium flavescens]|uniref:aa3-type cytochrome oxidase subunit CtaJ n=1 Tax=Mycolicibacterium flavescens TaxID=1776 RepID=UPI000A9B5562
MSSTLSHALIVGVPLALTFVLIVLIWGVGRNRKGPHPETYKLSEPWTHGPILWASDEPTAHAHNTGRSLVADTAVHSDDAGEQSSHATIGGGASGKW